jgi:hypothetical protein
MPLNILNIELGPTAGFLNLRAACSLHVYYVQPTYIFFNIVLPHVMQKK